MASRQAWPQQRQRCQRKDSRSRRKTLVASGVRADAFLPERATPLPRCRTLPRSDTPIRTAVIAAKTTLGAVNDDAPPMTLEELSALKTLCEVHGAELGGYTVPVASIAAVEYFARGLESPRRRIDVPLRRRDDVEPGAFAAPALPLE